MGDNFFGEFMVGAEGLMIRSCQGQGIFTYRFSSNIKTVNLEIFSNHEGTYTWRYSPDQSVEW